MNTQVLYQEIRARKEPTPKNGAALGRLKSGESARRNDRKNDGTPYALKGARTVGSGGKGGDYLKALPITIRLGAAINARDLRCRSVKILRYLKSGRSGGNEELVDVGRYNFGDIRGVFFNKQFRAAFKF